MGGEVDKPFGDRAGDGVSDRAVLGRDIFVLEGDPGARPIIACAVGTANQIDHLVRLDGARARIHRIWSNRRQIVDLESGNGAVLIDCDAALAAMIACVDISHEALAPIGDVFDGAL